MTPKTLNTSAKDKLENEFVKLQYNNLFVGERLLWCIGLPENYRVSNFGRIFNTGISYIKSDGRRQTIQPKILKPSINENGYSIVYINLEHGKKKAFRIHQLVAKCFIVNTINSGRNIINHKDGNKQNNHYKNLEWCNHSENLIHAYENNLRSVTALNTRNNGTK